MVIDQNIGALLCVKQGNGPSDSPAAAGDNGFLSFQFHTLILVMLIISVTLLKIRYQNDTLIRRLFMGLFKTLCNGAHGTGLDKGCKIDFSAGDHTQY